MSRVVISEFVSMMSYETYTIVVREAVIIFTSYIRELYLLGSFYFHKSLQAMLSNEHLHFTICASSASWAVKGTGKSDIKRNATVHEREPKHIPYKISWEAR